MEKDITLLQVTKADINHIPDIQYIANITWPVAYQEILTTEQLTYMLERQYSTKALLKQMQMDEHQFFVYKFDGDNAIGFGSLAIKNEKQIGYAKIEKLYVLPEYQGFGVGVLLLNALEVEAKIHHCSHLFLNVNIYNKAVEFYKRNNFIISERIDINIGNGYFRNDYVMEREIKY